jgi:hypothetical protein
MSRIGKTFYTGYRDNQSICQTSVVDFQGYAALMIYESVYSTFYAAPSCYYCVPYESLIIGKTRILDLVFHNLSDILAYQN